MLLLIYHLNEKSITIVKTEFLQHVTLFVISTLYTFALMLHEKWTRFQRHFFVFSTVSIICLLDDELSNTL